jgi:hypothetical protein
MRELVMFFNSVEDHPNEVMTLIALSRSEDIALFLFENGQYFMNRKCSKLLFAFVHETVESDQKYTRFLPQFLAEAFSSASKRVLRHAYLFLSNHFQDEFVPPTFAKDLNNPHLVASAALILGKLVHFNEQLLFALFANAANPLCFTGLLRCATFPEYATVIAAHANHWKSTAIDFIRLIYVLLSHHDLELNEQSVLHICTLLNQSLNVKPAPLSAIALLLKKLPLTESVVLQCEQNGFLAKFLTAVVNSKTDASIRAGTAFVERIANISWQPSLQILADHCPLPDKPYLAGRSIPRHSVTSKSA